MRQWDNRHGLAKALPLFCAAILYSLVAGLPMIRATERLPHPSQQSATQQSQASASADAAQHYFTDVELVNQDGQTMRLYSDVLKDHVVVINCFFATCPSVCPPMNANLEKVQEAFKDTLGKRLLIVSITVDPTSDTPAQLKAYAQRFHARPGRLFLTGKKENVDLALKKLGMYVEDKNDHVSIFVVGNVPTGLWKKAFGLAKAEDLVAVVQSVVTDKGN